MDWTSWVLLSALFLAFYDLAKKASARDNAVLPVLLCSTLCGTAAFAIGLAASGNLSCILAVNGRILALAWAKALIVSTSWIFTFCALRTLPISIATPIRASAPALVFLVALPIYGEQPTLRQGIGMLFVFAGYFAFSWAGKHEGVDFFRSRAVWCAFAGALCSAGSSLWDKYVFQLAGAPVATLQFWLQVGLVGVYAGLLGVRFGLKDLAAGRDRFQWRWTIPFVGVFLVCADWLYFMGLSTEGVPISTASLLRRASVVVTFVVGAALFREKNLLRKGVALAAILSGVALIV